MRCNGFNCLEATSARASAIMQVVLAIFAAGALISALCTSAQAQARYAGHQAWATYHVTGLPDEIRLSVLKRQRACGAPIAATHFFAIPADVGTDRFISLHFESFWCRNATVVCRADDCLHEIYASSGGRYRLVYSGYVRETKITRDGGAAGLEIADRTSETLLLHQWNGQRFVAIRRKSAE